MELDPRMELSMEDMTAAEIAPRPANILLDFLVTVKAVPHECVIRTGQP